MPGVRTASATTLAIIGLLVWVLDRYVFAGNLPSPISAAIYTIVPAAVGYFYTHKALNMIPPAMKKQLAAKLKNGQPVVLPEPPTNTPTDGGKAA